MHCPSPPRFGIDNFSWRAKDQPHMFATIAFLQRSDRSEQHEGIFHQRLKTSPKDSVEISPQYLNPSAVVQGRHPSLING